MSDDLVSAAIVKALGSMDELRRDKTANVPTKTGGSYSYSYTDLASVLGYVRPILAANDLVVMQPADGRDGAVSVSTIILHSSGQQREFPPLTMPAGRTPQEMGSAITYARRYSLLSALGLATEDDDGKAAMKATRKAPARNEPPPYVDEHGEVHGRTMTADQNKKLRVLYGNLGIKGPAEQKRVSAIVLGVAPFETHSALARDVVSRLIDRLTAVEAGFLEFELDDQANVVGVRDAAPTPEGADHGR